MLNGPSHRAPPRLYLRNPVRHGSAFPARLPQSVEDVVVLRLVAVGLPSAATLDEAGLQSLAFL